MSAAMWKKEDGVGTQPMPTGTTYAEAMSRFTKSATAFMEQVHLLTEARYAYQEAMAASIALRNTLDAGDDTLRSVMAQLQQVLNENLGEPALDRKKPGLVKAESSRAKNENTGTGGIFP